MADGDERAGVARQPFLQPLDRGDVEMVGRLVEEQHVGLLRECADDRRAPPLAARRGRRLAREINAELVGDRVRFMARRCVGAGEHIVEQGGVPRHARVLFEHHHAGTGDDRAATLVGVDGPCDQLEQCRLARAVAPDQRQPVARANVEAEVAEEPA